MTLTQVASGDAPRLMLLSAYAGSTPGRADPCTTSRDSTSSSADCCRYCDSSVDIEAFSSFSALPGSTSSGWHGIVPRPEESCPQAAIAGSRRDVPPVSMPPFTSAPRWDPVAGGQDDPLILAAVAAAAPRRRSDASGPTQA